jgi:hypothetical protein
VFAITVTAMRGTLYYAIFDAAGSTTLDTERGTPTAYDAVAKSLTFEALPGFCYVWIYWNALVPKLDESWQGVCNKGYFKHGGIDLFFAFFEFFLQRHQNSQPNPEL